MGGVPSVGCAENALLNKRWGAGVGRGGVLDLAGMRAKAAAIAAECDVRLPEPKLVA